MDMRRVQLQLKAMWSESFVREAAFIERIRPQFYRAFAENALDSGTLVREPDRGIIGPAACIRTEESLEEAVCKAVKSDIHGTLLIANTPRCAEELKRILQEAALEPLVRICYNTILGESSAHTLLLAPVYARLQYKNYRHVLIADAALLTHFIAFPQGENGVRFMAYHGEIGGFFSPLAVERNTLLRYYAYFKNMLQEAPVKKESLLENERPEALLALLVFTELSLIRFLPADGVFVLTEQREKRELNESALYRAATAHGNVSL
jgi:hypothetical protein